MKRVFILLLFILFCASVLTAEVRLPAVLADHMVFQRNQPVHIWGWADPGETVTVTFRQESVSTTADHFGHWSAFLKPGAAGGPFDLQVRGTNSIRLTDILVGDVWLASGQSNMEFHLKESDNGVAEVAAANYPRIRLFMVDHVTSEYPLDDVAARTWTACTPESAKEFSAVAYFFARNIHQKENVPIGVIESNWGGTLVESWTSLMALSSDASLMPVFAARARMAENEIENRLIAQEEEKIKAQAKAEGRPEPIFPWHAPLGWWEPSVLFNAMIAPLTPFPIRGVIWYQGESNSALGRYAMYQRTFQTMITDWRRRWHNPDLPFLYVQIANYKSTELEDWAPIREAQLQTLALRHTAMAVTIDIGNPDDVHPTNKREVGRRLSLAARHLVYGEALEYSGPVYRQATQERDQMRVWFDHAEGLNAKGGLLTAWEIAGDDGKYVPASAKIDGSTVLVSAPSVTSPKFVRYGWANNPECNLYNGAGLPASPFRSEQ
ncbi:MAG TPA: sialate O-acetylesterase [Terriglobales bacterium]